MRRAARKFHVYHKVIKKWLNELGIKRKSRKTAPKLTEKQKAKQRMILNKIARDEFRATNDCIDVVMDDETYINVNSHNFQGNRYYYFDSGSQDVHEDIRFRKKEKFPEKILIWAAVSRKGISEVMFRRQTL